MTTTSACFVADTTARTRDTLHLLGEMPVEADQPTDCEGRAIQQASAPVLVYLTLAGTDLRDVLDRGVPGAGIPRPDVIVTRDPALLAYAGARAEFFIRVLPWDRTYVLLAPGADSSLALPDAERDALARDALNADARGAIQPFEWLNPACTATPVTATGAPRSIVAYANGDAIARQLAERIVALAGARARPAWLPPNLGTSPRIAPVETPMMLEVLAEGRAAVGVVAIQRGAPAPCGAPGASHAWRGMPLVDSRAHVIVRRGSGAAFTIGSDGALHFVRRNER